MHEHISVCLCVCLFECIHEGMSGCVSVCASMSMCLNVYICGCSHVCALKFVSVSFSQTEDTLTTMPSLQQLAVSSDISAGSLKYNSR